MIKKGELVDIPGINSDIMSKIRNAGYNDVLGLIVSLPEWIVEDCGISEKEAADVIEKARESLLSQFLETV